MAVLEEYNGVLPSLGSDLHGFLHNLGSVYQEMKGNSNVTNSYDISFSCVPEQRKLTLHFRTATAACGYVWAGVLKVNCLITPLYLTIQTLLREPHNPPENPKRIPRIFK